MKHPEGFIIKWSEKTVYTLQKSIYRLKQASRSWNLISLLFTRLRVCDVLRLCGKDNDNSLHIRVLGAVFHSPAILLRCTLAHFLVLYFVGLAELGLNGWDFWVCFRSCWLLERDKRWVESELTRAELFHTPCRLSRTQLFELPATDLSADGSIHPPHVLS